MTSAKARKSLPVHRTSAPLIKKALSDIGQSIALSSMWIPLTFQESVGRHRRLFFGMAWIPLGVTFFAFILGYVYSWLRGEDYLPFALYLFAGYMSWQYIQSCIQGGFGLFSRASRTIENSQLPYSYFISKHVTEQLLQFLLAIPFFLAARQIIDPGFTLNMLLIFPAFIIYVVTGLAVSTMFAFLSMRYRDLETPVSMGLRIMFLFTPIIWLVESKSGTKRAMFIEYNPFYHFLEIMRAPLLGQTPDAISWIIACAFCLFFSISAFLTFILARGRIAYWV